MTVIGFHSSHEQVHPRALIEAVQRAEQAGFTAAMCSDHYFPWSARQGHSGFAWSWLGAALQATNLPFGVVNAPGQRYHPAILGQAMSTLGAMYPGRFWAALGSGQWLNEHVVGEAWPRKSVREARLRECVDVLRRLFTGEEVNHDGLVTVDRARIFDVPDPQPPLLAAAMTPRTAAWAAQWADGLITTNAPHEALREMVGAYRDAGGRGNLHLQVHLSYDEDADRALAIAHDQWRTNLLPSPTSWELATEQDYDAVGELVEPPQLHGPVRVSDDLGQHAAWLQEYVDLGFDELYLHHVGEEQSGFIDAFGERVLPQLDVTPRPSATS